MAKVQHIKWQIVLLSGILAQVELSRYTFTAVFGWQVLLLLSFIFSAFCWAKLAIQFYNVGMKGCFYFNFVKTFCPLFDGDS